MIQSRRAAKQGVSRPIQSGEMLELLGLRSGGHLPDAGMPERIIDGVRVYVREKSDNGGKKSSKHRVMAICPGCDRHISVGRLGQHVCGEKE